MRCHASHQSCSAGRGADTLVLGAGSKHTLTTVEDTTFGPTGLPLVTSTITIAGNESTIEGGGAGAPEFRLLAVGSGGHLALQDLTLRGGFLFEGNGGGVFNSGTLILTNSTVSGNSAIGSGGVVNDSGGTLTLTNSTVSGNQAFEGGGVFNYSGTLTLARTLISGNTATAGLEVYNRTSPDGGTVIADDFNLFGHNGHAGVSGFSPGPTDLVPTVPIHRILAPLANNSGPTLTHALLRNSPAVDAVESGCPPPSTDQREVKRSQDGNRDGLALCDIGAFELKPTGEPPSCAAVKPTQGCTVNGVPNQLCRGTSGNDTILGTQGSDVILGLSGKDVLLGRDGNDQLCGGSGNDTVRGSVGSDLIEGQAGNDQLRGENGNDVIKGGSGDDVLDGGKGNDRLDGQQGTDTCVNGERVNGCEETGS